MASRRTRAKRAEAKRQAIQLERIASHVSHERAKLVKRNLSQDNRETATVYDHLGRAKVVRTNAYSTITDSFVRMVQGGGLHECLNLDRPIGDSDRQLDAFRARILKR